MTPIAVGIKPAAPVNGRIRLYEGSLTRRIAVGQECPAWIFRQVSGCGGNVSGSWELSGERNQNIQRGEVCGVFARCVRQTIFTWRVQHGELRMSGRSLTVVLLILASMDILQAADKSPKQILGGKPAVSNTQSGRYYNGQGAFAGRSATSGQTTRLYDGQGRTAGRVESSKGTTRAYSGTGSYAGRTATSGNGTRFYDAKGAFNGRSTVNGNSTRFYDSRGAFAGRAETSGGATRFYDAQGRFSGSKR